MTVRDCSDFTALNDFVMKFDFFSNFPPKSDGMRVMHPELHSGFQLFDSYRVVFFLFLFFLFSTSIFAQGKSKNLEPDLTHKISKHSTDSILPAVKFFSDKGFKMDSVVDIELYKTVYSWLGTRYRYAGFSRKGIDCSGFVRKVLDSLYNIKFMGGSANMAKEIERIEKSDLKEGDLVFFRNRRKGLVSHVSIYLGNNKIAHSATGKGVIISDLDESWYVKHYLFSGRVSKLQEIYSTRYGGNNPRILLKQ